MNFFCYFHVKTDVNTHAAKEYSQPGIEGQNSTEGVGAWTSN